MSIRTLIADVDAPTRAHLARRLATEADLELVGQCGDGLETLHAIEARRPSLVLMDINLPRLDGFEVLHRLPATERPFVVFITRDQQHALDAFEVHAVDYLLKPLREDRFRAALDRARGLIDKEQHLERLNRQLLRLLDRFEGPAAADAEDDAYWTRLSVRERGRVVLLDVAEVDWIEAANNYVSLHVGGRTHLLRRTLSEMEARLDPRHFLRVHRSRIVNVDRVREMRPLTSGDCVLVLDDGTEVTSSRTYADQRRRLLLPAQAA